jgi:hypothetical protein
MGWGGLTTHGFSLSILFNCIVMLIPFLIVSLLLFARDTELNLYSP